MIRWRRLRVLYVAAAVAFVALLGASQASAYIYIGNGPTIARADNDGTDLDPDFIHVDGFTCGVAVDSTHIYWTDANSVGRAKLNGTDVQQDFVPFSSDPQTCGVAVNGTHVYWADRSSNRIGRAGLDGGSPDFDFVPLGYSPCGVAVDGSYIYYGSNDGAHALARAEASSGASVSILGFPQVASCAVAVRGGRVYYGSHAATDPTDIRWHEGADDYQTAPGATKPCGIAATSSAVYWTNSPDSGSGSVASVGTVPINADGFATGPPDQTFITGLVESSPCGLAINNLPVVPPPDNDGDGVPNATDDCPNVAGPVSNHGCPVKPPPDDDGDGVPNATDNCPNVPGPVSNHGCPVTPPPDAACAKAEKKLDKARAKLKKLRHHHASRPKVKQAKQKVKKAKAAVKAACD